MRKLKTALLIFLLPLCLYAQSQSKGKVGVQKAVQLLKQDSLFQNAVVGILVTDVHGQEIASWNPDMPLLTASTMKTVTTGLSLLALGPDYRYTTRIAYTGEVANGTLYGNLYMVGGGDPTLASKDSIALPIDSVFTHWCNALKAYGINRINGEIVADDRFFAHEMMPESWSWGNLGTAFGTGTSGLSFCENTFYLTLTPGLKEGDPVGIRNSYPAFPSMEFKNTVLTGPKNSRKSVSVFNSDLSPLSLLTGTLPARLDSMVVTGSNKFAPLSCAWQFDQFLNRSGVTTIQQVRMIDPSKDASEVPATVISEWKSPSLLEIVRVTNHISNNFFAETMLKTLGKERTGVGSYDSALVVVNKMIKDLNLPKKGFYMTDGSGLSRQNYVSARFLCHFYAKLKESAIFADYLSSFPVPGTAGTLKTVIPHAPHKDRLHAKSGSLANVRCYAGYVDAPSGMYSFAILVNNFSVPTSKIQPKIEKFLHALTEL